MQGSLCLGVPGIPKLILRQGVAEFALLGKGSPGFLAPPPAASCGVRPLGEPQASDLTRNRVGGLSPRIPDSAPSREVPLELGGCRTVPSQGAGFGGSGGLAGAAADKASRRETLLFWKRLPRGRRRGVVPAKSWRSFSHSPRRVLDQPF